MLRFGSITEMNPETGYARVKFTDDEIVSDWLQICIMGAVGNKFFYTFDVNEQVACLMDENSEDGVILGALRNDGTQPPAGVTQDIFRIQFSDDSAIEYNRATHELNINITGKVNITAESEVNIEAQTANVSAQVVTVEADMLDVDASFITIAGESTLTGNLTVSGAFTAASISAPVIGGAGVSISGGNLAADGEVSGATVKAGTIDLATHVHAGVQPGSGSTAPPTP